MTKKAKQHTGIIPRGKASNVDLINNGLANAARAHISESEQEYYKKLGEALHSIDFTAENPTAQASAVVPSEASTEQLHESGAYIGELLKSGMLPRDLEENEREVMRTLLGEEWYLEYGFCKEDL